MIANAATSSVAQFEATGLQSGPNLLVTNSGDDGDGACDEAGSGDGCTLREAIETANTLPGAHTISFAAPLFDRAQNIVLKRGELTIDSDLSIDGPDNALTTIDGAHLSRVFNVIGGTVQMDDLVIANGKGADHAIGSGQDEGGCISNRYSHLSLSRCVLTGGSASLGAGILNFNATLDMTNCTLARNHGIGDISNGGALDNNAGATATLTNCTLTDNSATIGGAIESGSTPLILSNTIIAGNSAREEPDFSGNVISRGHNLIGIYSFRVQLMDSDLSGTSDAPLDAKFVTDGNRPRLKDNGGGTLTIAIAPDSPAFDGGDNATTTDARGTLRPQFGASDIGAFELARIGLGVQLLPIGPTTNQVMTATPVIADASGVSFNYSWSVNGVEKQKGTRNTFDLRDADKGNKGDLIAVTLTANSDNGDKGSATNSTPVVNSAPVAFSSTERAEANTEIVFALKGADLDNESLSFKRVGGPTNGTARIVTDKEGKSQLIYRSRAHFSGVEVIRFVALDGEGKSSKVATLSINVRDTSTPPQQPNRAPVADNVTGTNMADKPEVIVPVSGSDPDGDPLTFKRVGGPVNGTGEIRRDNDGVFKMFYTPRAGFTGTEVIRYVALDDKGKPSKIATITIEIGGFAPNRAPVVQNVSGRAQSGVTVAIPVSGFDPDGGPPTFKRVGGPINGTGEILRDSDGIFKMFYTSRANFTGTEVIRYIALDDKGKNSNIATITITVTASSAASALRSAPNSAPSGAIS